VSSFSPHAKQCFKLASRDGAAASVNTREQLTALAFTQHMVLGRELAGKGVAASSSIRNSMQTI
jgi:hypothetical protein